MANHLNRFKLAILTLPIIAIAAAPTAACAGDSTNQTWSMQHMGDTVPDAGVKNPGNPKLTPSNATFVPSIPSGTGRGQPGWFLDSDAASLDFAIPNFNKPDERKSYSVTVRYWPPKGVSADQTFPDTSVSGAENISIGHVQPVGTNGSLGLTHFFSSDTCPDKETVSVTRHITDSDPQSIYIASVNVFTDCWKPTPPPKKSGMQSSAGHSVSFDATNGGLLNFKNDIIVNTGVSGDPLVGSAVNLPQFRLAGPTDDGFVFGNETNDQLSIANNGNTYLTADVPNIFYQSSTNRFYFVLQDLKMAGVGSSSPFFDPTFPTISGTYLQQLDNVLDPNSASYDPSQLFYFTYTPDANFLALTDSFNGDSESGGTNAFFTSLPVPEPSSLLITATGIFALFACRQQRKIR